MFKKIILASGLALAANAQAFEVNFFSSYGLQLVNAANNAVLTAVYTPALVSVNKPIDETLQVPSFDAGIEFQHGRMGLGLGFKYIASWDYRAALQYNFGPNELQDVKYSGNVTSVGGYIAPFYEVIKTRKFSTIAEYRLGRALSTGTVTGRSEDSQGYYSEGVNKFYSTDYFQEFVLKQYYYLNDNRDLAVGVEAGYTMLSLSPVVEKVSSSSNQPTGHFFSVTLAKPKPATLPFALTQDSFSVKISVKKHFRF